MPTTRDPSRSHEDAAGSAQATDERPNGGPGASGARAARFLSPQMLVPSSCGIVMCNIQGLQTYRRKYKVRMLRKKAIEDDAAIVYDVETHLRKEISDAEVKMEGFQIFRADR